MRKARLLTLLTVVLCCSACGAPSLRHKKDINKMLAAGQFSAAAQQLEKKKQKEYNRRDSLLYYLDTGTILHDADQIEASDSRFTLAQDRIDELFTQSISAHAARYLINDLTVPYLPAPYERALTYYYRAMNFLSVGKINDALVEANRAVYYLDSMRGGRRGGYQDPFVQYFMSLVFESAGKRDDARIARTRAFQAFGIMDQAGNMRPDGTEKVAAELISNPPVAGWGEVILVHANGVVPLKKSQTFQVAWSRVLMWLDQSTEGDNGVSPEVKNAIMAGALGNSITVAYPVLEDQIFSIKNSEVVTAQGKVYPTHVLGDVSAAAHNDLKNKEGATLFRMAVRAAAKRVAAVQARNALAKQNSTAGDLAEMFLSFLGAITEKADTRQWFTLPAEFRMTRFYVPPGQQDIVLRMRDGFGKIIEEHTFTQVNVPANGRLYLHYRTAK